MGQIMTLFKNKQSQSRKPVAMMRMMAPTIPIVKNQHMMVQTPYDVQPMQQQQFSQHR